MFRLQPKIENAPELMRDTFRDSLMLACRDHQTIVYLDADLVSAIGTKKLFEKYPDRAIQCGIGEANMVGVAAGLSAMGKIPFVHSFGCFTTRRAADQIMISCAYSKLNVRLIGSDPGVTAAYNGGTHMPFEDMGVLRSIPEITLIDVTDPVMLRDLIGQLSTNRLYGVFYLRFPRKEVKAVYADGSTFDIGHGNVLRDGTDVTIISSGIMVADALEAADRLESTGISARVVDLFTWKPMDTWLIAAAANDTGAIVTAENHNVVGGLYSAVSEAVAAIKPVPIERVGIEDRFGQVGSESYLRQVYGLTAEHIVKCAHMAIARK